MAKTVLVTGATSGIGRAIAATLAQARYAVVGVGRRADALAALEAAHPGQVQGHCVDLTQDDEVGRFAKKLATDTGMLDGLVLCAGELHTGNFLAQPIADLDAMYRSNLRAPAVLIQQLFPLLQRARGYIIFVNSSAGLTTRAGGGGHAAIQHALRALADTLRQEVNDQGVRVMSIYPGRTATPRMAGLFAREGRSYDPALLLQPEEVAQVVAQALALPPGAELTDVSIRPTAKSY